mmetsp:Transcript_102893/g.300218  ORF Transcript_102893/g.300218 Transcript_102893/m.300218 type:complete len:465 (+) Transcript_102893:570-1964(+)
MEVHEPIQALHGYGVARSEVGLQLGLELRRPPRRHLRLLAALLLSALLLLVPRRLGLPPLRLPAGGLGSLEWVLTSPTVVLLFHIHLPQLLLKLTNRLLLTLLLPPLLLLLLAPLLRALPAPLHCQLLRLRLRPLQRLRLLGAQPRLRGLQAGPAHGLKDRLLRQLLRRLPLAPPGHGGTGLTPELPVVGVLAALPAAVGHRTESLHLCRQLFHGLGTQSRAEPLELVRIDSKMHLLYHLPQPRPLPLRRQAHLLADFPLEAPLLFSSCFFLLSPLSLLLSDLLLLWLLLCSLLFLFLLLATSPPSLFQPGVVLPSQVHQLRDPQPLVNLKLLPDANVLLLPLSPLRSRAVVDVQKLHFVCLQELWAHVPPGSKIVPEPVELADFLRGCQHVAQLRYRLVDRPLGIAMEDGPKGVKKALLLDLLLRWNGVIKGQGRLVDFLIVNVHQVLVSVLEEHHGASVLSA